MEEENIKLNEKITLYKQLIEDNNEFAKNENEVILKKISSLENENHEFRLKLIDFHFYINRKYSFIINNNYFPFILNYFF